MKRHIISLASSVLLVFSVSATTQSVNLVKGNVYYSFQNYDARLMTVNDGKTITINGYDFNLADYDAIKVLFFNIDRNVFIQYEDDKAYVVIPGEWASYVTAEITGAHVKIIQSSEVSDSTTGEITYIVRGNSTNGSLVQEGSYKSTFYLEGVSLTNPVGAAIDIQNGKRIKIVAAPETTNTFIDGAGGKQKAAIYGKGHLEFEGTGTINVTGKTGHAISAKEYIEVKKCTINIDESVKDGINCNQYFLLKSGDVTIAKPGDDGIQVSFKDDTDREAEDTGCLTINGGKLTIGEITAAASKGLKCEGDFIMKGGEVTVKTSANGTWDSAKSKTKASACIGTDAHVKINGGTLNLTATGHGGKGINCDSTFVMNDGSVTISTSGNMVVYTNNTLYQGNYTGSTDRLASDAKSSPKGIKSDGEVIINGGTIDVTTTGTGAEGIESKSTLTVNDGNVKVRAYDDGINSANDMFITGGHLDVISSKNDGLDSNGNIRISGGVVMAFGSSSPECGLDANDEEGYTVYFTGGYILAAGGSHSYPKNSTSTQPYVTLSSSLTAGAAVSIGSGSDTYYTFTIPSDYKAPTGSSGPGGRPGPGGSSASSTLLISTPELKSGQSYTVKNGTSTSTATARLTGGSSTRPF